MVGRSAGRSSARDVADAFALARAEALRSGSNHIVAFDVETGLAGITSDIVIVDDGPPATANCRIDTDEIVHRVSLGRGVSYGTDPGLANGTAAPDDDGDSGNQAAGSSFTDADSPGGDASWVVFMSDGLPRRFSQDATATPPCTDVGPWRRRRRHLPDQRQPRLRGGAVAARLGAGPPLDQRVGVDAVMPAARRRPARPRGARGGFTLLEVMVTLGVLSFGLITLACMQLYAHLPAPHRRRGRPGRRSRPRRVCPRCRSTPS